MLLIAFWVALIIGLYFDAVLPKTYGERLPVFFCCMRKYWGCGNADVDEDLPDDEEAT